MEIFTNKINTDTAKQDVYSNSHSGNTGHRTKYCQCVYVMQEMCVSHKILKISVMPEISVFDQLW